VTHLPPAETRPARRRLPSSVTGWKAVPLVLVAALLVGSCDGSLRKSGWFLGGTERRIVTSPAGEDGDIPAEEATADPEETPPAVEMPGSVKPAPAAARARQDVEEIQGTGSFYNDKARPAGVQPSSPAPVGGSVTLNFVDADIRDVIKTVLGSTLGQNFVIDPKVKGTITLQTNKPIPRSAVLSTLEAETDGVAVTFVDDHLLGGRQLLGMSFLGRFRMTIDGGSGELLLEKQSN